MKIVTAIDANSYHDQIQRSILPFMKIVHKSNFFFKKNEYNRKIIKRSDLLKNFIDKHLITLSNFYLHNLMSQKVAQYVDTSS